ncbi:MAG TPA: 2,3-bisphosphoglycerate-independent phosphoglycerate mutase [Patescibacteria group bacterium]|nr:2,3-bisphosphoglycerate-independent phosphoglycerate mutase [Patescibacteria group bacterium]
MNHKIYKKVVLVILDGFGIAPDSHGNAITQARTPTLNAMVSGYPSLSLQASGPLVGLPWGEMGNSEVGHLNIGAGRIVGQDLPRITNAIQSGEFFKNPVFNDAVAHAQKNHSAVHLMGLVSPGGVHSFDEHLYALLGLCAERGQKKVFIHMFTDGRDTEPKIALDLLKKLDERIGRTGVGRVATIAGRFYAMDRAQHWSQTMLTYDALVKGIGETALTPEEAIRSSYARQIFDEMIKPTVITAEDGRPVATVADNDALIYFNFRSDRAIQLTQAFMAPEQLPPEFRRPPLQNLYFATMTEYRSDLPVHVAFGPPDLKNSLAEVLAVNKLTQFHIAESEKYAHVTAFFDCGKTDPYPGEERLIVTSPQNNARNYADHPEMSAGQLTEELVKRITSTPANFFVANFANTDMVGHTGNLQAGIQAVEFVDGCLKKIMDACLLADAALLITADHGNIEQMINVKTGDIDKDHTTNPVPLLLLANEFKFVRPFSRQYAFLSSRVPDGLISDIAPTVLALLGLSKPPEMTGINLLDVLDEVPKAGARG